MRVLIFTSQIYQLGGAERLSVELVEELNKRPGIRADLLSMVPDDFPGTARTKERLLNNGVPSVQFLGRTPASGLSEMIPSILKLRRVLRQGEYDIVETSMPGPSILACWATTGIRTHHVAGIHGTYSKERERRIADRFFRLSLKFKQPVSFYAISNSVSEKWAKYIGIHHKRIRVIYNSIAREYFRVESDYKRLREELGLPVHARIVLFVGRMEKLKGYDTIIDALVPVAEKYDLCILLAGEKKEEDLYKKVRDQINKDRLDHRFRFLGWRNDVPGLLSIADVLVHPPIIEGFGLILAEALACGLPIVASNVEGIPEVLEGTDSIMVPPEDPVALREGVLRVLSRTDQEAEQCLRKGKARAEFFRTERRADQLVQLFRSVLEKQA